MIVDGFKKKNLEVAVELIRAEDVVAFPTETVYGLGGNAFSLNALKKIYSVKARPFSDPLIFHVASHDQLDLVTENISASALKLIEKFWPGPLTLILKKKKTVPDLATAGLDTVAVRMPRHLVALALIKNSNCVIAAPSANRFQSISPTSALAVEKELGEKVKLILDGGPCQVGVESTVVSLLGVPKILRPGGVSREALEQVLSLKFEIEAPVSHYHLSKTQSSNSKLSNGSVARSMISPGLLEFHYAPRTPLKFLNLKELESYVTKKRNKSQLDQSVLICFSGDERKKFDRKGFKQVFVLSDCGNTDEAAKNLFSTLRKADEGGFKGIFALACPDDRLGVALNDRLKKAEHGF
jgi:L-threonylcarbamoyladenylate synthase